jgi:hypothetical protein
MMSLGFGLAYAGMTTIVVEALPVHQPGAASGMNANIRTIMTADLQPSGLPERSGYTLARAGSTSDDRGRRVGIVAHALGTRCVPRARRFVVVAPHRTQVLNCPLPDAEW